MVNEIDTDISEISSTSSTNVWKFWFIVLLVVILATIVLGLFRYQQYQNKLDQQLIQIRIMNDSYKLCEPPEVTVQNIAKEQTSTGKIILHNGTHVVSLQIDALCQQLSNASSTTLKI